MATPNTNDDKQPIDVALVGWLWIATDKLIAPARERIKQEIETHYAEAVTAHMITGQPEADAQANALLELGNAEQAGKRFRRQYLTESDMKAIEKLKWKGGIVGLLGISFCLLFFFFLILGLIPKHQLTCFILAFLMWAGLPVFSFIRSRHILAKQDIIQLLVAHSMEPIAYGLVMIIALRINSIPLASIFLLSTIIRSSRYLRILNKIRKAAPGWDGMPPQALASN